MSFSEEYVDLDNYFEKSNDSGLIKCKTFAKYAPRQSITEFITKYEIFKKILNIHGSIVECGVNAGQGLFTFAKLSSILEPYNYTREIFGFDTFSGFEEITDTDKQSKTRCEVKTNGAAYKDYENILQGINVFDNDRVLNKIKKIKIIKGDITKTVPTFVKENSSVLFSLINVDVDVELPTKTILDYLYPRLVKGGIIIFDEVSNPLWNGETKALIDSKLDLELKRFSFDASGCYAIKI